MSLREFFQTASFGQFQGWMAANNTADLVMWGLLAGFLLLVIGGAILNARFENRL